MTARAAARCAAVFLLVAAAMPGTATPARAAGSAGYCPDGNGVTVVVDYRDLGGGKVVRCAAGEQPTGLDALENAGFTITGTVRWGKGFVCRIDGRPAVDDEPCLDTPPASAYWSYWHSPDGGDWTYSNLGVKNRKPPPGSFEGWSFSTGGGEGDAPEPGIAPRRPRPEPTPEPVPNTTKPVPRIEKAPTITTPAPERSTTRSSPSATPATSSRAATTTPGAPASTTPTDADASPAVDIAADASDPGIPLGTIAGGFLVAVLLIAAALTAWRRRRSDRA
jgi:hypothetical protein